MSRYKLNDKSILFDFFSGPSGLSYMEIDKLVELFSRNQHQEAEVGLGGKSDGAGVDNQIRKSNLLWFSNDFLADNNCFDINDKIIEKVNEINEMFFKFDLMICEPLQLTQYVSSESGFYDYHIDASPMSGNMTRKLSFVIQLNNISDFEGGDFCVISPEGKEFNVTKESPELIQKGCILVFPSFMPHKVTPVTSGVRHTLVGWCNGPRFR